MASIDDHLYKCPRCDNLSFKKEESGTINKDQTSFNVREIFFTCIQCGREVKISN